MNWQKVRYLALTLAVSFLAVSLPVSAGTSNTDGVRAIRDYTSNENGYVRSDLPVLLEDEAFSFETDIRYVSGEKQQYYVLFGITFADYVASSWEVRLQLGESAGNSHVAIYRMHGDTGTRVMNWKAFPAGSDKTDFHMSIRMDEQHLVTVSIDGQTVGTLDVSAEYRGGWMAVATHTTKAVFSGMSVQAASLTVTDSSSVESSVPTDSDASTAPIPEQPSTGVVFPIATAAAAGISALVVVLARRRKAVRSSAR